MDLGDDLGVDLGCRTGTIGRTAPAGRTHRGVANRPFVDPLFGLPVLDLLALALGRALRASRAAGLADLLGATFGLGARLGTAAVLLATPAGGPLARRRAPATAPSVG